MSAPLVRPAVASDLETLARLMLYVAESSPLLDKLSPEDALLQPDFLPYWQGFPREGDSGVVADTPDGPIGAAWLRVFTLDEQGHGFVAPSVPELTLAVLPESRRQGIGTALIQALLLIAKSNQCSFVSAATARDSDAHRLLEKQGFADAGLSEEDEPLVVLLACL